MYEREEAEWDRRIEADAAAGKLDFLREQALAAKQNGALSDL